MTGTGRTSRSWPTRSRSSCGPQTRTDTATTSTSCWFDYTGTTYEQSAGSGWQYTIHPEDFDAVLHAWQQANRNGQECVVEHRLRHRSGDYRWNLTKAMPMRATGGTVMRW